MKIVVLDGYTVNPGDLSWDNITNLGSVEIHDRTKSQDIIPRAREADVLVVNKVRIGATEINALSKLKAICLLATGHDNVDIDTAKEKGIEVYNVAGYGNESVAQHTLALILALTNRIERHHDSIRQGRWSGQPDFSYSLHTVTELKGKKLGIIGYGQIGSRVGELGRSFGMNILTLDRSNTQDKLVKLVSLEVLLSQSDFITLHLPLTEDTAEMINTETLSLMKPSAYLINTGRGGLVNEQALLMALSADKIAGAALDVLKVEPPQQRDRLIFQRKVILTPHMAWRSIEARTTLIEGVAGNIGRIGTGDYTNRVV